MLLSINKKETLELTTEVDRGHKWSLPTCRFPVVAPFQGDFWYYKMDGWRGGGVGRANHSWGRGRGVWEREFEITQSHVRIFFGNRLFWKSQVDPTSFRIL